MRAPSRSFAPLALTLLTVARLQAAGAQTPGERGTELPLQPNPEAALEAGAGLPAPGPAPELTREDVATFLDGFVGAQLEAHAAPGATVAVVKDGRLLFARGYGWADFGRRVPVDPARSLFRVGSVSKLVTWTAAMQQVEEGNLELDADVNRWLEAFQIPATYEQPVSLANLMTHTPGFEDRLIGVFVRSMDELVPLETWLSDVPARVRPPGEVTAYSNYGASLAGYLVERASGRDFDDYVEARILSPLGMRQATFRQPIPEALVGDMAMGHRLQTGLWDPVTYEAVQAGPAGALSASATAMARFMIAHLEDGCGPGGACILQPDTVAAMHRRRFTNDPRVDGMTLGFMELTRNGRRFLRHGGDTIYFHSMLLLYPEQHVGLFVSYNAMEAGEAATKLMEAFIDRYYPPREAPRELAPGDPEALAPYGGSYLLSRRAFHGYERIVSLFMQGRALVTPEGRLVFGMGPLAAQPMQFAPVADAGGQGGGRDAGGVFREVDGPERLVFETGEDGVPDRAFLSSLPVMAFERAPFTWSPALHGLIAAGAVLLFLSLLIAVPVGWIVRRARPPQGLVERPSTAAPVARFLAAVVAVLTLAYLVVLATSVQMPDVVYGIPTLVSLRWIPMTIAFLAAVLLVFVVGAWQRGWWGWFSRMHFTLLALFAAAEAWSLWFLGLWG